MNMLLQINAATFGLDTNTKSLNAIDFSITDNTLSIYGVTVLNTTVSCNIDVTSWKVSNVKTFDLFANQDDQEYYLFPHSVLQGIKLVNNRLLIQTADTPIWEFDMDYKLTRIFRNYGNKIPQGMKITPDGQYLVS